MNNLDHFVADFREHLNQLYCSYDKIWIRRKRVFDTRLMFSALISMVIDPRGLNYRLMSCVLNLQSTLAGSSETARFSASSFFNARKRFSPYFFVDVSQWVYSYVAARHGNKLWFGYRMFAIDSSSITLPKQLEEDGFDSMNDCDSYHPSGMLTTVLDLSLGMTYDSILSQHGDERSNAYRLMDGLPDNSLLICDRGYFSFDFVYQAQKANIDLIMRISREHASVEIKEFIDSGSREAILNITPSLPTERKAIRSGHSPKPVELRLISFRVKGSLVILASTILDNTIKSADIMRLYGTRWDIEEEYKLLKSGLAVEGFRAKNLNGVLQEIFATLLLMNLAHAVIALEKGPKVKLQKRYEYSVLGTIKAIKWVAGYLFAEGLNKLSQCVGFLRAGICCGKTRHRAGRSYPRRFYKEPTSWTLNAEGVRC